VKNLFTLVAFFLIMLVAIVPASGSTGNDGTVTIVQPGEGVFSLGDTIAFGGKNTGSETTYLFITGPNLAVKGSQIQSSHPHDSPVIDGDASTFLSISGFAGNKWYWEWDTRNALIDTGMYTVYIASAPRDLPHINSTHYTKISFIMKRPVNIPADTGAESNGGNPAEAGSDASGTVTRPEGGTCSSGETLTQPSVVTQGNTITISGCANGNPHPGVAIWIIGAPGNDTAGYADQFVVHPDSTGFYSLDLDSTTASLHEGRYHVIVQHPMENNVLDIYLAKITTGTATDGWVWNRMLKDNNDANGARIAKLIGAGSLQGDDAYEALIQGFKDSGVDDRIAIPSSPAVTTALPPAVPGTSAASGGKIPVQQNPLAGGQDKKTAGSGSMLDQVLSFLAGIF
jgi:hypothetical protein